MEKSVVIENISKRYKNVDALQDISLNVSTGEIFGFIGPDGAGKTTLFRILTSLLLPDKGHASIEGFDVVKDYRKIRKITGYMPGRFSLYLDLTVEENLRFFATVFGTTLQQNYDQIKDIYSHIEPFKNRLAGKLSGGMKQKLALSCALIHKPRILILDEPTTGVDAVSRKDFWDMLKRLREKGITILVSTPYMDEANLCNRVALMQNGKIIGIDTPLAIVDRYSKELYAIRSDNMFRLVTDMRDYPTSSGAYLFGQYLHYTDKEKHTDTEKIREYLQLKGHTQVEITIIKPGIEDCFMELMGKNGNERENT